MKQTLRAITIGLVLSLVSQAIFAQYATAIPVTEEPYTAPAAHCGQNLTNTGKALMFTGASLAMTGLTIGLVGELTYEPDGTFNSKALYPIFTILGCAAGGAVALVGLPVYCTGSYKMHQHGTSLLTFSRESGKGVVGSIDLGAGIANYVSIDATGGYNVSNWLFLGAGMGYATRLNFNGTPRDKEDWLLPIYGNLKLTCGNKYVAPYMSTRVGYDLNQAEMYTALEFGSRIRSTDNHRGTSWWVGTKSEYLGSELYSISLTAGKSF